MEVIFKSKVGCEGCAAQLYTVPCQVAYIFLDHLRQSLNLYRAVIVQPAFPRHCADAREAR